MAVLTQRYVALKDESIVLSYDWDDGTRLITRTRCVNQNATYGVHVLIWGTDTGGVRAEYEATFAANSGTIEYSIPPGQRMRYPIDEQGDPAFFFMARCELT
jgi:hypothetical protein